MSVYSIQHVAQAVFCVRHSSTYSGAGSEKKALRVILTLQKISSPIKNGSRFAHDNLFGADFDPFLVRASSMNLLMVANTTGNVFHMDSLAFPQGHLPGVETARKKIPLTPSGSIDVLMTNPPFGSDIPITDPQLLDAYRDGVARSWRRKEDGSWIPSGGKLNTVAP